MARHSTELWRMRHRLGPVGGNADANARATDVRPVKSAQAGTLLD